LDNINYLSDEDLIKEIESRGYKVEEEEWIYTNGLEGKYGGESIIRKFLYLKLIVGVEDVYSVMLVFKRTTFQDVLPKIIGNVLVNGVNV
jgi:hypothetical protein